MHFAFCEPFCAKLPPARALKPSHDLEQELSEIVRRARAAWPTFCVPNDLFLGYLAERLPDGDGPSALQSSELFLACACLRHDREALAAFEEHYLRSVPLFVAHLRLSSVDLADLEQVLRTELLIEASGCAPKLASYEGRGSLLGWLRVTAVRAAHKLRPGKMVACSSDESLAEVAAADRNPELAFLKAADHAAFTTAFREALGSLSDQEQNVLRQHYIDGLSIDQLGSLYQTHRTSAARWLRQARGRLLNRTKRILRTRSRVSASECESILRQAQSGLDVTLRSLLK